MNKVLHDLGESIADRVFDLLPGKLRARAYGQSLRLDKPLPRDFVFKLAQTRQELEACFRLLHDEYVAVGYMKPDPSGMRVTLYHALPTTSTLMCRRGNEVIGTVSLIRENKLGFPMQNAFRLDDVFSLGGNVAEVSSLAIRKPYRTGDDQITMALFKFLYEYAEYRFDTRHLVIAVHPHRFGYYEDLLCFHRLKGKPVEHYDFVNGMPAVGAHLDLIEAKETFYQKYAQLPPEKNLFHYFTAASLPNGQFPHRRFNTTTDPVMTPEMIDYFFNKKTGLFSTLSGQQVQVLHSVYDLPDFRACLPLLPADMPRQSKQQRAHRRFPVRCPARLYINRIGVRHTVALTVYECSEHIFCAHAEHPLSAGMNGEAEIDLGENEHCTLPVEIVRLGKHSNRVIMLRLSNDAGEQGRIWRKFVRALAYAPTAADLEEATRFGDAEVVDPTQL
ncbi:MAG: hypothetical protein LBR05_01280 [Azoarcus sp.]|jgi:hypothetical protein|nr:hypothetical protein [Azoarcus sp.]